MNTPIAVLHLAEEDRTQSYILNGTPVTLGQSPDNAVVLDGTQIAAYHARLEWIEGFPHLIDLGSKNGTTLKRARLAPNRPYRLAYGETFAIGQYRLALEFGPALNLAALDEGGRPLASARAAQLVQAKPAKYYLVVAKLEEHKKIELQADTVIIGRDPSSDIPIDHEVVSRRHARLVRTPHGYEIADLESTNGLVYQERRISRKLLVDGDVISITGRISLTYTVTPLGASLATVERPADREDVGRTIAKTSLAGPPPAGPAEAARELGRAYSGSVLVMEKIDLEGKNSLAIGRHPDNDLQLKFPTVSRRHARINQVGSSRQYTVEDLRSSNGTRVNDEFIEPGKPYPLHPGNTIRIGPIKFIFAPGEIQPLVDESRHMRLDALHLNQHVAKGVNLLQDISLAVLPREFVAVVGVSGAGKSTIMNALTGFWPASDGQVLVNGTDLYKHFDAYRTDIGYVPQDDIIHKELSTQKALEYVARLRLPSDLSAAERRQVVEDELRVLGLSERKDVPVSKLSGGQRKRVSIGVERLTRPGLFFLDEATSGLDPGTENQLMRLMRQLADDGQTILLITHATKNVVMCDLVLFLAKGGNLAYFGPPDQALPYFGVTDFDEIYEKLQQEKSPSEWADLYRRSPQYQTYVVDRLRQQVGDFSPVQQGPVAPAGSPARSVALGKSAVKVKRPSSLRQFFVLTQRYLDIIRSDKTNLLLLLLIAPVLGAMDFIAWNRQIFDPILGKPFDVMTMLFLFSIIPFLVGALGSVREIVKEKAIYQRERTVNLKIIPYLGSKVAVGTLFAFYHAAALMAIKLLAVDFSHLDAGDLLLQYLILVLVVMSGVMWGLLISAIAPREEQAMLLVIVVVVIHMVFSGGILSLQQLGPAGEAVGVVTTTKWAFEGYSDLNSLMSSDCEAPGLSDCQHPGIQGVGSEAGQVALIDQLNERFGDVFEGSVRAAIIAQLAIMVLLFVILVIIQKRKDVI
ncbi:MAG: FHA domain-containing protein [Candidatus Promineifilaceae bacterium]